MNKRIITVLAALLILSLPLTGCRSIVKGSGTLNTEVYNHNDFSQIVVEGPFDVDITRADSYYVGITANENLFGRITVEQEGDILR